MTSPTPPAAVPSEEERFAAASLGFNPHDASTWAVDIVNRLVRIRSERGDQAFAKEVANLTTSPTHSPFNACCYRDHCKALEARALAAEAALAEKERQLNKLAEDWDAYGAELTASYFKEREARLSAEAAIAKAAEIADMAADREDARAFESDDDLHVAECRGGERVAKAIAAAIRAQGE